MQELIFDQDFEELYCPVTGKQVLYPDDYSRSPALVFIYLEEVQDFEYMIPGIRENFPSHFDPEGRIIEGDLLYEKLKEEFYVGQDKVIITFGNCGTASFCFDFNYKRGTFALQKT